MTIIKNEDTSTEELNEEEKPDLPEEQPSEEPKTEESE